MQCLLVCDTRDRFQTQYMGKLGPYNDHPTKENALEFVRAVRKCGVSCKFFGGVPDLIAAVNEKRAFPKDTFFLNFSDGLAQSYARVQVPLLCEILGVPYSGSAVFPSALINNKYCSCLTIREAGIMVPRSFSVQRMDDIDSEKLKSMLPVFIKPNAEGSSLGITAASYQDDCEGALRYIEHLLTAFDDVLIESYVDGDDVTVFLIGNHGDFPCAEPIRLQVAGKTFLGIEEKAGGLVKRSLLTGSMRDQVVACALKAFEALGCRDIARVDFRVDKTGMPVFIEANTCPRFSRISEVGFLADSLGKSFEDMVGMLIDTACRRLFQS